MFFNYSWVSSLGGRLGLVGFLVVGFMMLDSVEGFDEVSKKIRVVMKERGEMRW